MESFFRLGEGTLNEPASGHGRPRQESEVEYLGASVKTFPGEGPENGLEVLQHQIRSLNQEVAPNSKPAVAAGTAPSRYESQKRRDWNSFGQYLRNRRPPIALEQCTGAHIIEFLRYLDQFGKTKVHINTCHYFGVPNPPHPCPCPLRQAWGSLDALIGRLRAAFEENGGKASMNPFGARLIRLYLREVREKQAKARGIAYGKKKKKGRISPQTSVLGNPMVSSTSSDHCQVPYEHHLQQLPANVHGVNLSNTFSVHDTCTARSTITSASSQGYATESYIPENNNNNNSNVNGINPVPRVYHPFEIHSFMEDMPSRDVSGWVWNPVCS